jgi:hypothetical protein
VIGGEYSDQNKVGNCFTRDWCEVGAVVVNPASPRPRRADRLRPAAITSAATQRRLVLQFRRRGLADQQRRRHRQHDRQQPRHRGDHLSPERSVLPYDNAEHRASGLSQVGGDLYATYTDVDLVAPVERYTAFATPTTTSRTPSAASSRQLRPCRRRHLPGGLFHHHDPDLRRQPLHPGAIRAVAGFPAPASRRAASLTRPAAATFKRGARVRRPRTRLQPLEGDTYRVTTGLSGEFGNDLSWDVYYQYGRTDRVQHGRQQPRRRRPGQPVTNPATIARSNALFFFAADAVVDPATGQPTCRALLSADPLLRAAAAGCVPINLFGIGNVTQAGED